MNTLTEVKDTAPKTTAQGMHEHIAFHLRLAKGAALEVYRGLKEMRDSTLYTELGYETFENYTEEALGIKRRQAFNYIQTYESLPWEFLESHVHLGVTKLQLLTSVPVLELEEFSEVHDLEELSTRELEELTRELSVKDNQISLLEGEKDRLQSQLDILESQPVDVAVQEPDEKTAKALEDKVRKEEQLKQAQSLEKLKNQLKEKEAESNRAQKALEDVLSQHQETHQRVESLQKQLDLAGNDHNEIFKIYFNLFQDGYQKLLDMIETAPETDRERFTKATSAAMAQMIQGLEGQVELG